MIQEFRKFIMRGNVVDLAVGVIIGAAFGAIVNSLVNDIIMPPIGLVLSGIDFKQIKIVLQAANEAANKPEVAINIGLFLNALISFVIIAFVLFLIIRAMNSMMTKEAEKPAAPPAPSTEEKLLMEIRDLLAKGR
ncbi:MAG: large-conductance mechanosensitive channel protein MscL [Anaerolineae bacterium]|nr:large-conductance mechanosensitive channel protein MscL [Anaerolineae bacterium]